LNPESLKTLTACKVEPTLKGAMPGSRFQFLRHGYFCVDTVDSRDDRLIFNRIVTLRDSWAKIEKAQDRESRAPQGVEPRREPTDPAVSVRVTEKRADFEPISEEITIQHFSKIDLRVGIIRQASLVEGAKKLIKLMVDLGEGRSRQIFAGIRTAYPDPDALVGRRVVVVANLKPRQMKFGLSEGMVLTGGDDDSLSIATFDGEPLPGQKVS
jgi:methionine--tRNA ligase beta chain